MCSSDLLIRQLRDAPAHVVMVAKQGRPEIEGMAPLFAPVMPGKALASGLSYLFDEVFAMMLVESPGKPPSPGLLTQRTLTHEAKDRSGSLALYERPNLAKIAAKIAAPRVSPTVAPVAESKES